MRCPAPGRINGEIAAADGISTSHGDVASTTKNNAPLSLTARRTSDSGSTPLGSGVADSRARAPDDGSWSSPTGKSYCGRAKRGGDHEQPGRDVRELHGADVLRTMGISLDPLRGPSPRRTRSRRVLRHGDRRP